MKVQVKILAILIIFIAVIACGGSVNPTGPGGTITLFSDGFEGGPIGVDWLNTTTNGTIAWTIVAIGQHPVIPPHSGSGMAFFPSFSYVAGQQARLYRSSGFAIPSSVTAVTLTFYMYHDTGYSAPPYDRVQVQVSIDGGTTWNDVGSAIDRYDGTDSWEQHTLDLTTYKGQTVTLGFLGISQFGDDIYLDDVLVTATY